MNNKISIYTASKTKHAPKWLQLRAEGINVISTWIDEYMAGQSTCLQDLAIRCIEEPQKADVTLLYCEPEDNLRFALVEVGAALSAGKKIIVIGGGPSVSQTMIKHPNINTVSSISEALAIVEQMQNMTWNNYADTNISVSQHMGLEV